MSSSLAGISSVLFRVSASGGSPVPLTENHGTHHETAHFAPWFLPDGHHFLFVALSADSENRRVFVADFASRTRKQLPIEGTRTIYVSPGYLLFARDGALMAQRFDADKLETTAEAAPMAEQADSGYAGAGVTVGYFSASQNGVLVYTSGRAPPGVQLTWFDRTGKRLETAGAPTQLGAFYSLPRRDAGRIHAQGPAGGSLLSVDTRLGTRRRIAVDHEQTSSTWWRPGLVGGWHSHLLRR